jgi:curved DNA-binding protein CbpA
MNYYEILGISKEADQAAITQAAQLKAKELNSEFEKLSGAEKQQAFQTMQTKANQINIAFRILSHPEQRQAYDNTLAIAELPAEASLEKPTLRHANLSSSHTPSLKHWSEKFTTIEKPSSVREVLMFVAALLFFLYMLSGFFIPATPSPLPPGERPIPHLRAN